MTTPRQIKLQLDYFFDIKDGQLVDVVKEQVQYDGNDDWLVEIIWKGQRHLVNKYGRIICG